MHTMSMNAPPTTVRRAGLTLTTEWLNATLVRITASGDLDASNAAELYDYVLRRGANCQSLILDLKDITFFGTAGFSALQSIDARSSRASVSWMLLAGPEVARVLRICDPERTLPRGV